MNWKPLLNKSTLAAPWAAGLLARRAGFRWELRRKGDLKMGLWRKRLSSSSAPPVHESRRLVFVPGFGDTPLGWIGILGSLSRVLRDEYDELVLVQFPGTFGPLLRDRSFDSMDLLLSTFGEILDTLKPAAIMGHSLGGWISTLYALECGEGKRPSNPNGPERLILISPAGAFGSPAQETNFRGLFDRVFGNGPDALTSSELRLSEWRRRMFGKEPVWFRLFVRDVTEFLEREETRQFIRSVESRHFVGERLPSLKARVSFLWGELDDLTPAAMVDGWFQRLSAGKDAAQAYALLLRQVGHSPHFESPLRTTLALARLLREGRQPGLGGLWWRTLHGPVSAIPAESGAVAGEGKP